MKAMPIFEILQRITAFAACSVLPGTADFEIQICVNLRSDPQVTLILRFEAICDFFDDSILFSRPQRMAPNDLLTSLCQENISLPLSPARPDVAGFCRGLHLSWPERRANGDRQTITHQQGLSACRKKGFSDRRGTYSGKLPLIPAAYNAGSTAVD
jgi:hypothetical protein